MSETPRTDAYWESIRQYKHATGYLAKKMRDKCRELERENTALRERVKELEITERWYKEWFPLQDQMQPQHMLGQKIGLKVGQSISKDGIPLLLKYVAELERDRERLDHVLGWGAEWVPLLFGTERKEGNITVTGIWNRQTIDDHMAAMQEDRP